MRKDPHSEDPREGGTGEHGERSAATPDRPGEDELLDTSPYDALGEEPTAVTPAPASEEAPTDLGYGAAPTPGSAAHARQEETDADGDAPARRRRWVIPVVIAVAVLAAAAVVAAFLLGGSEDDKTPEPAVTASSTPEATDDATDEASDEPTDEPSEDESEEPTEEATEPDGELAEQLDESVTAGETTFEVTDDGFATDEDVIEAGALEAYTATYKAGDDEIDVLATRWSDNDLADEYAQTLVDGLDGAEQADTGHTYINDTGTYWAFLLEDGRGSYIWTTDRGHVLRITGSIDYVDGFFSNYSL